MNEKKSFPKTQREKRRVFLTQPKRLFEELPQLLKQAGLEPVSVPVSESRLLEHNMLLCQAIRQIEMYDWLILPGASEAELFFEMLRDMRIDVRALRSLKILSASRKTDELLEERGLFSALSYPCLDQLGIAEELLAKLSRRERYLILWDQIIPDHLTDVFSHNGISYDIIPVSRKGIVRQPMISLRAGDRVLFCDALSAAGFFKIAKDVNLQKVVAFCLTEAAFAEAKKLGFYPVRLNDMTVVGIVEAAVVCQEGVDFDEEDLSDRNRTGKP